MPLNNNNAAAPLSNRHQSRAPLRALCQIAVKAARPFGPSVKSPSNRGGAAGPPSKPSKPSNRRAPPAPLSNPVKFRQILAPARAPTDPPWPWPPPTPAPPRPRAAVLTGSLLIRDTRSDSGAHATLLRDSTDGECSDHTPAAGDTLAATEPWTEHESSLRQTSRDDASPLAGASPRDRSWCLPEMAAPSAARAPCTSGPATSGVGATRRAA